MSTNVRGDRVVHPLHVAEYDRVAGSKPLLIVVAAVILFTVTTIFGVVYMGEFGGMFSSAAGVTVLTGGLWYGWKLAAAANIRAGELTRSLTLLQDVVVFDPSALSPQDLWDAAGIAEELADLEFTHERLANARFHTAEQEMVLTGFQEHSDALARRILDVVHPNG